jgi:hypothetical protein
MGVSVACSCGSELELGISTLVEFFCTTGGQSLLSLPGIVEKNFSFHFKRYNLTIRVVKCCETFCTCSPSSLVLNPTVKSAKK